MKKPPTVKQTGKKPKPAKNERGLFAIGNTGGGRPRGSPDRRTAPFRKKVDDALPDILDQVIKQAKTGDMAACKILIDKGLPALKPVEQPRALPLAGGTLTERAASVVDAVSTGSLSVDEGTRLIQALGSMARILEVDQLEERISKLEAQHGKN